MYNEEYLMHYGVLGMKWGVRRANKNTHNKNYTDKQRKNDRAFYGKGGEKRINKHLNEGYGLRGARHLEVERKEKIANAKKTAKKGAKKTANVMARVGMMYVADQAFNDGAGTRAVKTTVKYAGRAVVSAYMKARGGWDIRWYD